MSKPPPASRLVFLVEEPSMKAFLEGFMPRLLVGRATTFDIHSFQGKSDLLANLSARLRAYARWLPSDGWIVVVLDRDQQDCLVLKKLLEAIAAGACFATRSTKPGCWRVANRIVVEELEAWYFGDWEAVRRVYPRVEAIDRKRGLRDPDAIKGGTWEALERELKRGGYFRGGLQKITLARAMGDELSVDGNNRSASFRQFRRAILDAVSG